MEGDAAAAILQALVQNLIDTSKKEISLIRGLNKEAAKLTARLDTNQKFLNAAEIRTLTDEDPVKHWLRKLQDVAFDADHVLDELNYHHLSKKIMNPDKKNKVLFSCFSFSNHISRPRKMALRIKEVAENLEAINREATELGLVPLANVSVLPVTESDSYTLDPIFIGRDGVVSEIVDKILTATQCERAISILTIVGMGGLGKTTLTRKVFNHEMIKAQFGSCIWVHVSKIFDPVVLLKKILKEFMSCAQAESRQEIVKNLAEALKDKIYLLVLDDAWNEDSQKWEDFMKALSGVTSTKGNAIIMTTRNTNVAATVNPLGMHQLEGLSEEDCWSIIKEKAFGKGVDAPSEIESIGRKIAKRCQGSPLAANVVGGVLQRDKSEENWVSIEQKWLTRDDGENITRILRLSFDSLSAASLKKCFAYCSMFPKGHVIYKQELIEQWMAEGFLQPDDGSDGMESLGEKFINILLNNSLLQVAKRDDSGNVKSCLMHDLVHDLACSVLGSYVRADGSSRVRYMVLNDKLSSIDRREMRYFRTLVLMNHHISGGVDFSHFEGLHVLTLQIYQVEELPISIKKLIHLRKLNISGTSIKNLPEWIGELHYLQTLRAETGRLEKLPSTMKYLINLRHLYVIPTVLPAGIGRLTSLQTLRYFIVGDENGCNIAELESLNNLKGELHIYNLERVRDNEEAAKANLFRKSKILELYLHWDADREGEIKNDENVLEGLQPHAYLKKLNIDGFMGKRFPAWTMKMAVQNVAGSSWIGLNKLIEIELSWCVECEEIPPLGHLPNLKSLSLLGLKKLKRINPSVYGVTYKDTGVVFPALETLNLDDMPELAEWAEVECEGASEVQVFPRLRSLTIVMCNQLTSVPTHTLSCLERLKIQSEGNSMAVANVFRIKYAMLRKLCLEGIDDLEYLPDWLFNENPNLSSVKIRNCPKLRELPPGLRTLSSSLKKLIIDNCPCLEWIADDGGVSNLFFTSLWRIKIERCDALLCLPLELIGSSLEQLSLSCLISLKNLSSLIDCLARSPRLDVLKVGGIPNIVAISGGGVGDWPLGSLRELDIDANIVEVEGSMDGVLQGCCHSLKTLRIRGREEWDCVPESIQRLTVIECLTLENFGMKELPQWLGNLSSSLRRLYLCNCKKLRRLPSMDAIQGLVMLSFEGCPELVLSEGVGVAVAVADADSQYPNIFHTPCIRIDGNWFYAKW